MPKRWVWCVVGGVVLVLAAVCYWPSPHEKPNTQLIEFLQKQNEQLAGQNKVLAQASAVLSHDRDKILLQRDSLKAVHDTAIRSLRKKAAELPPAPPDSMLRFMYDQARQLIAATLTDNERLHRIVVDDSLAMEKQFKIEINDSSRIFNLTEERNNAYTIADDWHQKYDDLNKQHHALCGRKCGFVLGVLSTIGAAVGLHKVQEATK